MELNELNIAEANRELKTGEFSSVELTKSCLYRIKKIDEKVKSFITITEELALNQAEKADKKLKQGEGKENFLLGIPCSIKDVIATKGVLTTAASDILNNYIAPYDATLIEKLKKRGMVMVGKVNCDAFAHGSSTENSDFFATHNPWDLERVPGGSSGGSASSVASDECFFSIGTDTGGSIRQPAAFCGIVGLKPTYGRVSRYGLISMTSSTDCPSIMTKNVADAAIVLAAIAGKDKYDSTSSEKGINNYIKLLESEDIKNLRVGLPNEYFHDKLNSEIKSALNSAIKKLEDLGAKIIEISLQHTKYAVPTYYIITPSELSSNLARFDGIKYGHSETTNKETENLLEVYFKSRGNGFGDEAKRRIMLGTYVLSSGYYDAYYLKAQKVRALIKKDFDDAFKNVDIIVTPTSPDVAFKIGKNSNLLDLYMQDVFLCAASLAGLPAISVPCGFAKPQDGENKMPVGMQIIGKPFEEGAILNAANVYEKNTEWHKIKPNILKSLFGFNSIAFRRKLQR